MVNTELPTTYYSESKKQDVPIATMDFNHLKNTTLKVERTEPGTPVAKALRLELDKREEEFAAKRQDYSNQGYKISETEPGVFIALDQAGDQIGEKTYKSEDGAWGAVFKSVEGES